MKYGLSGRKVRREKGGGQTHISDGSYAPEI